MVMDVEKMEIIHLAPMSEAPPYAAPATGSDALLADPRPAKLTLAIRVDGETYRAVRGGKQSAHAGARLIESGRFFQRTDVTDLVFRSDDGRDLNVDARLETAAWPDRLALILAAQPKRQRPRAGPSFGRVRGGYGFDGKNHIEAPHSPELEPEHLTLELWVYVPEGPPATKRQPWVLCKNGNEWGDGHYGFMLVQGVPLAILNIGGGRENMHRASGKDPKRARPRPQDVLKPEQWHHLAMSYDGRVLRLYVNGRERSSQAVGKPRTRGRGGLAIGRRQDNASDGYHFRGNIDEVRLYSRALSPEEVRSHYQSPETVKPGPSLVREWTFDANGQAARKRPSQQWQNAALEISLHTAGTTVSNRVRVEPGAVWTFGQTKTVAVSLAPGRAGVLAAEPQTALRVDAQTIADTRSCPVNYDPVRGWFRVSLDRAAIQGEHNDAIERVRVRIANPSQQAMPARLLFDKPGRGMGVRGIAAITGPSPLLRDADGFPTGIPVQISKNWHRQPNRDLVHQGPWLHGFALLRVPALSEVCLEFVLAYAHWGGVASASHAQLCLVGWGGNQRWDQAALGAWGESICYDPEHALTHNSVCDVRPVMVHAMRRDKPVKWTWTSNVGGADFLRYFDAQGVRQHHARVKAAYLRYGPNLTEVTYSSLSQDSKLAHQATVSLGRTDDVVRGIYRLRMDVREPAAFTRLVLFQVGADTYSYTGERKMALGAQAGLAREWATQWGGGEYRTPRMACSGRARWISLHEAVSRDKSKCGAWANRGIIIRQWDALLAGQPAQPFAAEYGVKARGSDTSVIDILPPPGITQLLPGDYVDATFEHIIMPQRARDYYGPNENLRAALGRWANSWRMIHREAVGNDLSIEVSQGRLERVRPTRIHAQDDHARFALTGGLGYVPLTIAGLSSYRRPTLEVRTEGGQWRQVDQSVHGNDFWQADYQVDTRSWDVTYNVPCDSPGDVRTTREFRFFLRK